MKILYICSEFYAGMMPFGANIVNTMEESEHDIFAVFVSSPQCDYKTAILNSESKNYIFINTPMNKFGRGNFRLFAFPVIKVINKICKENKIDVIHLLTEDGSLAFYLKFLLRKSKVYYTVHDLIQHESKPKNFIKKLIHYLLVEKRAQYLRDNIENLVTCSKNQLNELVKKYEKKAVFYHSFPSLVTSSIKNGNKTVAEVKGIKDYILFFGRIELYKGIHILYNEYCKNQKIFNKPLVIAGSGDLYFQRIRNKEEDIVFINRYIEDEELNDLFSNAYCVIYPYISATQSGVLSLAYYYNKPIIVSNVPFFRECIVDEDSVCFFDPTKPETLTESFSKIKDIKEIENNYYDPKELRLQLEKSYL
ncbi:glycosyltransferase [Flavobacterium sp. LC2016-01]|uniref:glycosyltransferase n=1 Tax=Flavobacterium sp. LC2016-01 TaxID=2675876 RepID=UPI0012BB0BC2|nr:glycosyltransferase [Flavobacterium sp. LC2016-01]MTH18079.1 glycosyltransferase [Flavobacterium sp. LC2016-01]